jgi:hypothetical protein
MDNDASDDRLINVVDVGTDGVRYSMLNDKSYEENNVNDSIEPE